MAYNHTFHWPAGPESVIVTGTFDNWTQSLPMVKTSSGDFEITLPLKPEHEGDEKLLFKFVVDGQWTTSSEYESEDDGGNVNNVIYYSNLAAAQSSSSGGAKIPEAGGLVASTGGVSTTVMPSSEGQQTSLTGEPGIALPSDPHQISAFSEVRDVDAKELNEKMKKEANDENVNTTVMPSNKGVQDTSASGVPGIAVPANAADIKEFSEVRDVDAKELNEKMKAEESGKKRQAFKQVIRRNKKTGEEEVVEKVPIDEESKTLDPKANGTETPPSVEESTSATPATTAPATATSSTTAAAPAKTVKKPTATPKKETKPEPKKEKSGFFRKIKKALG